MTISCFLPCRAGSERIPRKNVKRIGDFEFGLIEIKLAQLNACHLIDEIILSTNDWDIIQYAKSLSLDKVVVHERVEELSSSSTSTDELMSHALKITRFDHILWTHVTSPFYTTKDYVHAIEEYFKGLNEGFDSLMSVKKIQSFIWDEKAPINYSRGIEKWPRTQTLGKLYEIDSAVFLNSRVNYHSMKDRIGSSPLLLESDHISSFDIDWPIDFIVAEVIIKSGQFALF